MDFGSYPPPWLEANTSTSNGTHAPNPSAAPWQQPGAPSGAQDQNTALGMTPSNASSHYSSANMHDGSVLSANHRAEYLPKDCLDDIRKACKEAQGRITALGNALSRQPGIPANVIDMVNTDLRHIAQQFVHTSFYCRKLETKLQEMDAASTNDRTTVMSAHALEIGSFRRKLQVNAERIAKLEEQLRDSEAGYGNVDKRRKVELEKKTEKINNQKRRIKEQQDQIEKLKDKYVNPGKPGFRTSRYDDSESELDFPLSAASDYGNSRSPVLPAPKYTATLDRKDEEFLLHNLQKISSMHAGTSRHGQGGLSQASSNFSSFSQPMNNNTMNGAIASYGYPPHMGQYGAQMTPDYGYGGLNGHMPAYPGYGGPGFQTPAPPPQYSQSRAQSRNDNGRVARVPEPRPSNALVVRRNDDAEVDPETKVWKDMLVRFFTSTLGWSEINCSQIIPGAVEEVTSKNTNLWEYILKISACYKDPQASPKHALFMLNSPSHRTYFIARLLIQYVQQEVFTWKFWLGWDEETDVKLNNLGPIIEATGHALETRRDARQQLRRIIEEIAKDEDYGRFKKYKQTLHSNRLSDIGRPFASTGGKDTVLGLQSLANSAMEISMKMLTSRLTFTFTWNECAVKFSHESHIALNSEQHGLSLQHKHTRVGLVVTPSISYRDDSGRTIVPRGVSKAQVLIMN